MRAASIDRASGVKPPARSSGLVIVVAAQRSVPEVGGSGLEENVSVLSSQRMISFWLSSPIGTSTSPPEPEVTQVPVVLSPQAVPTRQLKPV